jgi:murein DD-endopeptidase MepM/ murein hydrolase activator NlpD
MMRIVGKILMLVGAVIALWSPAANAQDTVSGARLTALPGRPEPGSIVRLELTDVELDADSIVAIRGIMASEPLHFVRAAQGRWRALGGVPVDASNRVTVRTTLERASGSTDTVYLAIPVPQVPPARAQPLAVDTQFTKPPDSATVARIAQENELARSVGRRAHETPRLWSAGFLRPRASVVTSSFGSGRVFNGRVTSRHLGVDFRGNVGDPVRAANRGVVALVDTFFLAGTLVYIDHGAGVVTGYFHLSKPLVAVGDTVTRGQTIGLVGATGRVTAPHLHWTARYGTVTVNPLNLVALDRSWYSGASVNAEQRTSR